MPVSESPHGLASFPNQRKHPQTETLDFRVLSSPSCCHCGCSNLHQGVERCSRICIKRLTHTVNTLSFLHNESTPQILSSSLFNLHCVPKFTSCCLPSNGSTSSYYVPEIATLWLARHKRLWFQTDTKCPLPNTSCSPSWSFLSNTIRHQRAF